MSRPLNANIDEPRPVSIVQRIEAGHVIGLLLNQELMHVVQHMANLSAKVVDEIVVVIATAQRVASFVLERRLDLFIFGFSKASVVVDAFCIHCICIRVVIRLGAIGDLVMTDIK